MVSDESIEMWKRAYHNDESVVEQEFPQYFVSQPPHRDDLTPVYYKVESPFGPVFWRRKGDTVGRETSFLDLFLEEKDGFGVNRLDKEYTPWTNSNAD